MSKADLVHFVGSVPLASCEQVFRTLSEGVGGFAKRLPDGETAERSRWIYFQREMLEGHPAMETDPDAEPLRLTDWTGKLLRESRLLRIRPDVDPATVSFPTGYDQAALQSWSVFERLRDEGVIASDTRFQVSLPSPMSSACMYVSPGGRDTYVAAYERSLLSALHRILDAIPPSALTIQWDICQEVLEFEHYFPHRPDDYESTIFRMLGRLGDAVPVGVELGFHLCYGSPQDEHLVQPKDAGVLAKLISGIVSNVRREVDYIHIPVPKGRDDDAYFAPLRDLQGPVPRLYLGLIHHDDEDGDLRRIAVAQRVVPEFGIASECGWGRSHPAHLHGFLCSHRRAAEALEGGTAGT